MPAAGYPLHSLKVAGIDRTNPLRAARALGLAVGALGTSVKLLRRLRPDAVMGGGGYVAGPVGLAAAALRRPLVLTEADSHLGISNRLLAPLAKRVFLAFPLEGRKEPRFVVSGRPLPTGTNDADRYEARRRFGIGAEETCLLVFGGSIGARTLNQASIEAFGAAAPCAVLHASGRRDYDELAARLRRAGQPCRTTTCPPTSSPSPTRLPQPTSPSRAPGARCSRWPQPGCRRSWCPTRMHPPTTRPATPS